MRTAVVSESAPSADVRVSSRAAKSSAVRFIGGVLVGLVAHKDSDYSWKAGENLSIIAKKYNVTVKQLIKWNNWLNIIMFFCIYWF